MPKTYSECGINEKEYMSKLNDIANKAFEDQCTTANPRLPLVSEIEELMKKAYYGE
jgi:acetaldehyde dehydrogenase/alcohol dehydrogenase